MVGRWGSEEAGGCKLIMDRSMGMLESVSHRICQFRPCQVHCTVYLAIQELSFALRATFSCIHFFLYKNKAIKTMKCGLHI